MSYFVKICPAEAELFHADRQTEGQADKQTEKTKPIVFFRNFANAPKTAFLK
jgi:hypothetical protein